MNYQVWSTCPCVSIVFEGNHPRKKHLCCVKHSSWLQNQSFCAVRCQLEAPSDWLQLGMVDLKQYQKWDPKATPTVVAGCVATSGRRLLFLISLLVSVSKWNLHQTYPVAEVYQFCASPVWLLSWKIQEAWRVCHCLPFGLSRPPRRRNTSAAWNACFGGRINLLVEAGTQAACCLGTCFRRLPLFQWWFQ